MSPTRSSKTGTPRGMVRKKTAKTAARKAAKKPRTAKTARKQVAARKKAPVRASASTGAARRGARKVARGRAAGQAPAAPSSPDSSAAGRRAAEAYKQALADYTACMELLQKKDWRQASRALADFIGTHQRERELNERARMYLRVCGQHLDSASLKPESLDDRCYVAVVLANEGDYDTALKHLDKALQEHPASDKALYLKASTLALRGDRRRALDILRKAIVANDRNRIYAANNPDFSGLRDDEEFLTLTTREDEER